MAVGLNLSEVLGEEAFIASRSEGEFSEFPPLGASISISYPGKMNREKILEPVAMDLIEYAENGISKLEVIPDNSFCLCDNFYGLHKIIESGKKATLAYLDPPYGTGMDFQSRDLQHAYKDKISNAAYFEYMRRRVILIRESLAEEGSIYVHIGHQMLAYMKIILDEVFGESNFRNIITRRKCSSKNFTKKQYSNINDYILFYSKSKNYKWNKIGITPEKEWIDKEYNRSDDRGKYKLVPIHAPGIRNGDTGKPWRGVNPPPGKHWQYSPEKLDLLDKNGNIHWSKNGNPRRKVYLTKDKTVSPSDYWDKFRDAHHQSVEITGYPTEKNLDMLKMIVRASSDEGDLVIDPFCGSGTTLHAARDEGRRWIGFDQSVYAAKTVIKRMNYGMEKMGDFVKNKNLESGFPQLELNDKIKTRFIVDQWFLEEQEELMASIFC